MGTIHAGVTLMQDFCRPGSNVFASYIDYMAREEAQRNQAIQTFNLFNDYMGNPEKSTGLFTEDKDSLTQAEKNQLKDIFTMAQDNGSVMWQTVVSFDNKWLEKNGIYRADTKFLDERKVKEVSRKAIAKLLKSEGLEHAVWSAGIHYNTDNLHVHFAIVEPYPMRQKMMYKGHLEVRGKFKQKNINASKSVVVNEIMHTKEVNQRINLIIREDIVQNFKSREFSEDTVLQEKFLKLCQQLPNVPGNRLNYNNRGMGNVRKQADEISRLFLNKYCPEKYQEFLEIVEHQSRLYGEAYGGGTEFVYKENKEAELQERLGNAVLQSAKDYFGKIEEKEKLYVGGGWIFHGIDESDNKRRGLSPHGIDESDNKRGEPEEKMKGESEEARKIQEEVIQEKLPEMLTEEETGIEIEADENVPLIELEDEETGSFQKGSSPFVLKPDAERSKIKSRELEQELERAGEYLWKQETSQKTNRVHTEETVSNEQYKKWFQEFKIQRAAVNEELREGKSEKTEAVIQGIPKAAETNPFSKCLLGEMYLYGKLADISPEAAQQSFKEALGIFEQDVEGLPNADEVKGFCFKDYVAYRIGKLYDRGWGTECNSEIAANWYEKSGTSYAKYSLGNLYYDGKGVEQDFEQAFSLYEQAADNPFAKLKCAVMCEKGLGTEQDIERSEEFYKEAFSMFQNAEKKQPDAVFEYQLGNLLYRGKGCEQNTEEAISYLEKAASQRNIPAVLLLSSINIELKRTEHMAELIAVLEELSENGELENAQYTLGRIYTADWEFYDLDKGIEQYGKAAEQGNEYAQYQLGKLYINPELEIYDLDKGIEYLKASAEQGNEYAQYQLGKLYINPELEMYDLNKGIEYLKASAEQGNEYAQYQLGKLYINPELEMYDLNKGIEYLKASAEQGNEYAQYQLGKLYINSELEICDLKKGVEYLEALVEQGNQQAQYILGKEYLDKTSQLYAPEKGMEYIQNLAEDGHEYAQVKLGFEYIKGEHVPKNLFTAREWFEKAADQGNPMAKDMLHNMTAAPVRVKQYHPMGELDKAMMYLRKSLYEAQRETQKNLILYERELQEELNKDSIYI